MGCSCVKPTQRRGTLRDEQSQLKQNSLQGAENLKGIQTKDVMGNMI